MVCGSLVQSCREISHLAGSFPRSSAIGRSHDEDLDDFSYAERREDVFDSFVYLVEGSRVRKTAVPHLVDDFRRLNIVFAKGSSSYRQCRSPSYTFLVLLSELPLTSCEELSGPSAFTAQG